MGGVFISSHCSAYSSGSLQLTACSRVEMIPLPLLDYFRVYFRFLTYGSPLACANSSTHKMISHADGQQSVMTWISIVPFWMRSFLLDVPSPFPPLSASDRTHVKLAVSPLWLEAEEASNTIGMAASSAEVVP